MSREEPPALPADRYRIEGEIGRGGMAVVYRARDLRHDRDVAIKVMARDLATAPGVQRFLAEIRTTARLQHPHILPLLDSGETDGRPWFVTPFVEGETLRDRLNREPRLPIPDALRIAEEIASALASAHQLGIVHRDIKPENILLREGSVLVADFGIALAIRNATGVDRMTATGNVVGTWHYMSPEQATGDATVDGRSDVFSLGSVLYEMLVGEQAFGRQTAQAVVRAILTESVTPPGRLRKEVPATVERAVLRAMEKEPGKRFPDAAAFGGALTDALRTISGGQARTRRSRVLRLLLVPVALLVAIGSWWLLSSRSDSLPRVRRLALLPLEASGTGSEAALFTEGLTREIIAALTNNGVRVIGYESVRRYPAASTAPLQEIGRALDVDAIATGRLIRDGGTVRVAFEVANAATGENLWAHETATDSSDLSSLADEAAGSLAGWILGADTQARRPSRPAPPATPTAAYTDYLVGMADVMRATRGFVLNGIDRFTTAIDADSSFARAYAGLGFALTVGVDYGVIPASDAFRRAGPAIARALQLDSTLALAHIARARMLQLRDWNWTEAEAEYLRAIDIEPGPLAWQTYGWFLEWYLGRALDGLRAGETAVQLDPANASAQMGLAWRLLGADSLDRAIDQTTVSLALDSSIVDAWWIRAEAYLRRGDLPEAERSARQYVTLTGDEVPANSTTLGEILARSGQTAEARAFAARLAPLAEHDGPSLIALARVTMALGDRDGALSLLEQAVRRHVFTIPHQWYWDPIRNDPRFQAVMRAQGL